MKINFLKVKNKNQSILPQISNKISRNINLLQIYSFKMESALQFRILMKLINTALKITLMRTQICLTNNSILNPLKTSEIAVLLNYSCLPNYPMSSSHRTTNSLNHHPKCISNKTRISKKRKKSQMDRRLHPITLYLTL